MTPEVVIQELAVLIQNKIISPESDVNHYDSFPFGTNNISYFSISIIYAMNSIPLYVYCDLIVPSGE